MADRALAHSRDLGPAFTAGVVTTALTLSGAWLLSPNVRVFSWYINYIIPVGAMLAGALAGSGYALGFWRCGVRVSGRLLWCVVLLQVVAWGLARYLDYLSLVKQVPDLGRVGFWAYFDHATRQISMNEVGRSRPGDRLGVLGYGVRLAEVVGFVGASTLPAWILGQRPYCESCARYLRVKVIGSIPAGVKVRRVKKAEEEDYAAAHSDAAEAALARLAELTELADGSGDRELFAKLAGLGQSARKDKLTGCIEVELAHCPSCMRGAVATRIYRHEGGVAVLKATGDLVSLNDSERTQALLNELEVG